MLKATWEDSTCLYGVLVAQSGRAGVGGGGNGTKKGSYFTQTSNTTELEHLSTCKHWKAKLEERKKRKEKRLCKKTKSERNGISCGLAFFLPHGSLRGN